MKVGVRFGSLGRGHGATGEGALAGVVSADLVGLPVQASGWPDAA